MWRRVFWSALLGLVALVLTGGALWAQEQAGDPGQGPARRMAREPGERGPRPAVEAERLQAEIRELLARAERLEAEGQFEEAKAVRDRAETLKAQLQERLGARRAGAEGAGVPGRPGPEAVARLRNQANKLEAEGKVDAATKLREQADQLENLAQAAQENFQRERELRQQVAQLGAQARELRAQGKEDDAAEVAKKAEAVEEQLRALVRQREKARDRVREGVGPRLAQARQRAERLEAAGNVEEARRLRQGAERWEKGLEGGGLGVGRGPEGERPAGAIRRGEPGPERAAALRGPEGAPPQGREVQEELRRLRAEVQELRQEVIKLRELLMERRGPREAEVR